MYRLLLTCYNSYETFLSFLNNAAHWTITFVRRYELLMVSSDMIQLFLFLVIAARSFYHLTKIYLGHAFRVCTRFLIRIIYYDNVYATCLSLQAGNARDFACCP